MPIFLAIMWLIFQTTFIMDWHTFTDEAAHEKTQTQDSSA